MLLTDLEKKLKLAKSLTISSFVFCLLVIVAIGFFAFSLIQSERKNIYVLDAGVPLLVQRTDVEVNREVEAKGHVALFHSLFFTLPPDDHFIKSNIQQAMYLIDESGLKQYNNLKEQGYYNAILANSMALSIKTDSITLDMSNGEVPSFVFYGTQRIERETSILKRRIITTGFLRSAPRTDNNPHGFLITNWKTLKNEDIENRPKKVF